MAVENNILVSRHLPVSWDPRGEDECSFLPEWPSGRLEMSVQGFSQLKLVFSAVGLCPYVHCTCLLAS